MSHSIVAAYRDHQVRAALHTGGESAEWPELANALVDIVWQRTKELTLDPPVRAIQDAWAYPVRRPNGEWPNLICTHAWSERAGSAGGIEWWTHSGHLILICGPGNGDEATMQELGTAYIYPLDLVLQANESLDGRCTRLTVGRITWGRLAYAGGRYYGLTVPVEAKGQAIWTPEWLIGG